MWFALCLGKEFGTGILCPAKLSLKSKARLLDGLHGLGGSPGHHMEALEQEERSQEGAPRWAPFPCTQ